MVLAVAGLACSAVAVLTQEHAPQARLASEFRPPVARATSDAALRGPVLTASVPISLAIPAIGVRSPLIQLGLAKDGTLEVPAPGPQYDEAGWYRGSPSPGSLGPAVIVGHVDSLKQGPSVFFRLASLHTDDLVTVTRADSSVATFTVDSVARYPKAAFPTALVYGNTDRAALRLITCGGAFDTKAGQYTDNVVVLAHLVTRKT